MKYVGVGRRFVALFIDSIIIGVVGSPFATFQHLQTASGSTYRIEYRNGGFFAITALTIIYFTLMEGYLGASAGKFALGIRVVQEDGSKLTWKGAIIRNLLRIIDAIPLYLIGAILVWTSPKRQRLGDRGGNTVVIRKGTNVGMGMGDAGAPGGVMMPPPPPPPPV